MDDNGKPIGIKGVITNEIGLDKSRKPKDSFEPGMEFHAPITLFAEGAHGSMTQKMIKQLGLRDQVGADPQTYGLGVKEVWRVKPEKHQAGLVTHTMGWPLDPSTYGGSWMYHMEDNMVSIGLVVGLDYQNPYLSPFREFQRMKHHPFFKDILEGGECLAYGARTLNEGGYQSIPKLHFPGGALVGCAAGFLNVPKIKGTHNAMKSGIVAAEAVVEALAKRAESGSEESIDLADYKTRLDDTYVMKELYEVRNLRPSFNGPLGFWGGLMYSGLDSMILKGRVPWTFHHHGEDHAQTKPASQCEPIEYPKPDGKLSFDILTSVSRTGTNHAEDQPVHWWSRTATTRATSRGTWAPLRARSAAAARRRVRVCRGRLARPGARAGPEAGDQQPELHPLLHLLHQDARPEHPMGRARGRRRTQVLDDLITPSLLSHNPVRLTQIYALKSTYLSLENGLKMGCDWDYKYMRHEMEDGMLVGREA